MIQNVWAIGRNYGAHAKELGNAVPETAAEPIVFLKSGSSVVQNRDAGDPASFTLPAFAKNVHFETEIVLEFGPDLRFDAITVGIDLTARDAQDAAKAKGQPWTLAKSFRDSTLIGRLLTLTPTLDIQDLEFRLKVNGTLRQTGFARDMIHPVEKLRRFLIERFPVVPGDLVMTGTPEGVGPVVAGDRLEAEIPKLLRSAWTARQL